MNFWLTLLFCVKPIAATLVDSQSRQDECPIVRRNDHSNYDFYAIQFDTQAWPQHNSKINRIEQAKATGDALGLIYVDQVGELRDYFLFAAPKTSTNGESMASVEASHHVERRALEQPYVKWVERQLPQKRLFKRDASSFYVTGKEGMNAISKRIDPGLATTLVAKLNIKDPWFSNQWHLANVQEQTHDMNVANAWLSGVTGHNVTVAFIDDGLDHENPDLADNFV